MVRPVKQMDIYESHKNVSMQTCPNVVNEWKYRRSILNSVAALCGKLPTGIDYCRCFIYGNMDYGISGIFNYLGDLFHVWIYPSGDAIKTVLGYYGLLCFNMVEKGKFIALVYCTCYYHL